MHTENLFIFPCMVHWQYLYFYLLLQRTAFIHAVEAAITYMSLLCNKDRLGVELRALERMMAAVKIH